MENTAASCGSYITFASFSPSSVFTTLSAAMSNCNGKQKQVIMAGGERPQPQPRYSDACAWSYLAALPPAGEPELLQTDDMSDTQPPAEQQHHRLLPPALPALTASDQSCCCVTPTTPERGPILCEPPEGACRHVSNH